MRHRMTLRLRTATGLRRMGSLLLGRFLRAAGPDLTPQPPSLEGKAELIDKLPLPFREGGWGVRLNSQP